MPTFKKTMEMYTFYLFFIMVVLTSCSAIPKPGEKDHKERVMDKKLSEQEHGEDDNHNNEYDHEAFLGKEDAKTFDQLTPEESRERLGIIVDKIDKDKDGFVTETELKDWVQYVQKRYVLSDTERMWKEHEIGDTDTLKWESYKKRTYGYEDDPNDENSPNFSYKDQINRDERRWKAADKNQDGLLSKEEFSDFLHPEEAEHMRDIVVQETIEDIDKDKDGFISLEEYIADVYDEEDDDDDDDDDEHHDKEKKHHESPEWVKSEKEQFATVRDKNGDGKLDKDEVKEWIIPEDFDHSQAEATHLMYESDADKDGKLSKSEILEKYDLFVGSQATDFGEALTRHDEF